METEGGDGDREVMETEGTVGGDGEGTVGGDGEGIVGDDGEEVAGW